MELGLWARGHVGLASDSLHIFSKERSEYTTSVPWVDSETPMNSLDQPGNRYPDGVCAKHRRRICARPSTPHVKWLAWRVAVAKRETQTFRPSLLS